MNASVTGWAFQGFWLIGLVFLIASGSVAPADEGMWLFKAPPLKQLKEKYQFAPDAAWLSHVMKSSVRFNSGGSGSFVSPEGLILTNHHVGADALQKFGDAQHDYIREGFYASTQAEERKCYDLELNILDSIEDVTTRVQTAIQPNATVAQATAARRSVIANIEKESNDKTGLRSNVVTLFGGGSYQLYRYKRYTDVRLVFAPEEQMAYYGGDPDNFEYPRYDLDICIFRVYENNQPLHSTEFLKFNPLGPKENELVFVSGNPYSTQRSSSLAELTFTRDNYLPLKTAKFYRIDSLLTAYSARSFENRRQARDILFNTRNNQKALNGRLAGLYDPEFFKELRDNENKLRAIFAADPKFAAASAAYAKIDSAAENLSSTYQDYFFYEGEHGHPILAYESDLFRIARLLVRNAAEQSKPNDERLPEFQSSGKPSLDLEMFSEAPIHDGLEIQLIADGFLDWVEHYHPDDPLVQQVLAGKSPHDRAVELVTGTQLKDLAFRHRIAEGGRSAINQAHDPILEAIQVFDDKARAARKVLEESQEIMRQAYGEITRARFDLEGDNVYPDATFTLRLSYGVVKGYEQDQQEIPAMTRFSGLYERASEHNNEYPFNLTPRWLEHKKDLDLQAPFDFVSTNDITSGNSGSPVINRAGEFVGIIFDGNLQSLTWDYLYREQQARAISVDSAGIIEALRKVYNVPALVTELMGGG